MICLSKMELYGCTIKLKTDKLYDASKMQIRIMNMNLQLLVLQCSDLIEVRYYFIIALNFMYNLV
jgi:hypothetical protein